MKTLALGILLFQSLQVMAAPLKDTTIFTAFPGLLSYSAADGLVLRLQLSAEIKIGDDQAVEYRYASYFKNDEGGDFSRLPTESSYLDQDAVYVYLPAKPEILEKVIRVFSQPGQGVGDRGFGLAIKGKPVRTNIQKIYMAKRDVLASSPSPHLIVDTEPQLTIAFFSFGDDVDVSVEPYTTSR